MKYLEIKEAFKEWHRSKCVDGCGAMLEDETIEAEASDLMDLLRPHLDMLTRQITLDGQDPYCQAVNELLEAVDEAYTGSDGIIVEVGRSWQRIKAAAAKVREVGKHDTTRDSALPRGKML